VSIFLKSFLVSAAVSLGLCLPTALHAGSAPKPPGEDPFDPGNYEYLECGTEVDPVFYQQELQKMQAQPPMILEAPERYSPYFLGVAFHIVRNDDGSGGVPEYVVTETMENLNLFYEEGGYAFSQISSIEYIDNTVYNTNSDSLAEIRALHDVPNAINIYFSYALPYSMGGYSGSVGSGNTYVIINSYHATKYSVAAHEVGHVLYLFHTHQGYNECTDGSNCNTAGDLICDTPADPNLLNKIGSNCSYIGDDVPPCGGLPYDPDTRNLMSYAPPSCTDHFTPQQFDRMEGYLYNYLSGIIYDVPHAAYVSAANGSNSNYGTPNYPYATISYALSQLEDGDTIFVYPGTYNGTIIVDKDVAIISLGGPLQTTLTASQYYNVVEFHDMDAEIACLDGFGVLEGKIGVWCKNANPLITHCVFDSQNTAIWSSIVMSGGSANTLGPSPASLINNTIMNCANGGILNFSNIPPIIYNNIVTGNSYGIYQGPGAAVPDNDYNDIWDNPHYPYYPQVDSNYVGESFGIGSHSFSADPILSADYRLYYGSPCVDAGDPDPVYNDPDGSRNDVGAIPGWIEIVPAGTLYVDDDGCQDCYTTISDAVAAAENYYEIYVHPGTYNESINFQGKTLKLISLEGPEQTIIDAGAWGWAVNLESGERPWTEISGFRFTSTYPLNLIQLSSTCSIKIDNCIFSDFSFTSQYYDIQAIIVGQHHRGTIKIERNLFYNNYADRCILIYNDADSVYIINNTFDDNRIGIVSLNSFTVCKNNIVTNHSQVGVQGSFTQLDYNDVWNNASDYLGGAVPGPHDISNDPLYADAGGRDYHLTALSPCINAGDPAPEFNDPDDSRNDMGAYPYEFIFIPLEPLKEANSVPELFSLNPNRPNPFNPTTEISFVLPKQAHVKLEIYNVLGQKVTTLLDKPMDAGYQAVTWDGTSSSGSAVSSGIYFYRLTAGEFSATKKMSLVK
jgi:hypothetical protein